LEEVVSMKSALVIPTASAALAVLAASPASATPPPPPVIYSWTGCYIGGNVGGGLMTDSFTGTDNRGTGGIAGGQAGCNYQNGNWVFGVEGQGFWSGIKDSENGPFTHSTTTTANRYDYTFAGRAGIAFDRTFVYGKGGWAWGQFDFDHSEFVNPYLQTVSKSGMMNGFLVGVGVEHALTQNWTIKLEYDYISYGNKSMTTTSCISNSSFSSCNVGTTADSATKQIFTVGANYLFHY
jgi:outer membrane immunogenic protein